MDNETLEELKARAFKLDNQIQKMGVKITANYLCIKCGFSCNDKIYILKEHGLNCDKHIEN